MRVGTICYATEQGIGHLAKWFHDAGVITDVMAFRHGSRPTRMEWYPAGTRELVGRPFTGPDVEAFILSVDVMLFFETPFDWEVIALCRRLGVKTVIVPMYEWLPAKIPHEPDGWICPSLLDQQYLPGSPFLQVPVPPDVEWHQRRYATRWLLNAGNLGYRGHKGTVEILKAVKHVRSRDFRLTVRAQDVTSLRAAVSLSPTVESDPRVIIQYGSTPREMLFSPDHDVFVMAEKYNGLSLPLIEARVAGMLVVTSDRFPTNTWLPREPLIPVKRYEKARVSGAYREYDEAVVTPETIAETIDRLVGTDITQYSLDGKAWAEANGWAALKPLWIEGLRKVVES